MNFLKTNFDPCPCEHGEYAAQKGPGPRPGLPYQMFWVECKACKRVMQKWEDREECDQFYAQFLLDVFGR